MEKQSSTFVITNQKNPTLATKLHLGKQKKEKEKTKQPNKKPKPKANQDLRQKGISCILKKS